MYNDAGKILGLGLEPKVGVSMSKVGVTTKGIMMRIFPYKKFWSFCLKMACSVHADIVYIAVHNVSLTPLLT